MIITANSEMLNEPMNIENRTKLTNLDITYV